MPFTEGHMQHVAVLLIVVVAIAAAFRGHSRASADDWPQWRGPRRNAVSAETGLMQSWPAGGPKVAWQASGLGTGYSSVVVGRGRLLTMGRRDSDVIVTALDAATGNSAWTRKIGETARNPCSTPTLDGELLYALDPDGELVCLKAATGEVVWQTSFVDDFGGRMMSGRGYGESPLIDGEQLICTPGGADAALVALDKRTGAVIWKVKLPELGPVGRDGAGFSSVVVTEAAGLRQYVQLVGRGVIGIDARDGRFLWAYNAIANNTANIPTPVVHNEFVFAANGYTAGSVLLKLVADSSQRGTDQGVKAEVVYTLTGSQFQNHHGGIVRLGDYLFGGHGNNNGLPTCLEFQTGRVEWKRRGPGVGSAAVVYADGHLYFRYQNGVVALIEASNRGFNLKGTLEIPGAGGDSWAHPVVANGRLYLREQDTLWVYDLRADAETTTTVPPTKPAPALNAALTAVRKAGISVEPLSVGVNGPRPAAGSRKGQRLYEYAMDPADKSRLDTTLLVTLADSHLSSQGVLLVDIVDLLKDLPGPLVVSLAGTQVSDAGLQPLERLSVVGLNLELCGRVTNAGLERLRPMERLRVLVLAGTRVTHVGLQSLVANTSLLALDLELCDGITDDACETLGAMRQLKSLVLKKTGFEPHCITDVGLRHLQDLSHLEMLNLYGNQVTDSGLTHLQKLNRLRELNLSLLPITDAGLTHLESLHALERLELLYSEGFSGPTLTNAGMEFLEPLTNLTALNLTGARLSDAGLDRLRALNKLKTLQLVRTQVTAEGMRAFRAVVPGCEVIE
jgi:outer membrane protein assembly factor BamB